MSLEALKTLQNKIKQKKAICEDISIPSLPPEAAPSNLFTQSPIGARSKIGGLPPVHPASKLASPPRVPPSVLSPAHANDTPSLSFPSPRFPPQAEAPERDCGFGEPEDATDL